MADISPKYSFKNFKFSTNFYSSIKNFIYVGAGIVVGELAFNNLISTSVAGLIMPMIAKSLEYCFKKYV